MTVVAWIFLIVFGLTGLTFTRKLIFRCLSIFEGIVWFLTVMIAALSAGVIWGGLFQ